MWKKIIMLASFCILTSCNQSKSLTEYQQITNEIKAHKYQESEKPTLFDYKVFMYNTKNGYEYTVQIDNFVKKLDNVKVMLFNPDLKADDINVTFGVDEIKSYNGVPKTMTNDQANVHGIRLNGISKLGSINLKGLLKYQVNNEWHSEYFTVKKRVEV